jgi:hypothetical protein
LDICLSEYKNSETWSFYKPGGARFFLSWKSYYSQHGDDSANIFYYLNTETIHNLNGDTEHDNMLLKKCLDCNNLPVNPAPVIFLVTSRQNTYFLAVFDFSVKKALILGHYVLRMVDTVTVHAEWESWDGLMLWERIGKSFTWLACEIQV